MGKDNKKDITDLISRWHSIAEKEIKALSEGNFDNLEKLLQESTLIQSRLDNILSKADLTRPGIDLAGSMKKILDMQSGVLEELQKGTIELSHRIGKLRKNKASLRGYRQTKHHLPRFMSEKT